MTANVEYEVPTWDQIYSMLLKQAEGICTSFKPDIIVGICRGGWIPARILSDLLDNSNLASIKSESYNGIGTATHQPVITQHLSTGVKGKKVLLVDEVADSGYSLKLIIDYIYRQGASEIKTATLYYKLASAVKPDYFEEETSKWIIFPWDTKEAIRDIYNAHKNNSEQLKEQIQKLIVAGISKSMIFKFIKNQTGDHECLRK